MMQQTSDEVLIGRIKEGEILAFELIVKRYERPLRSFVYKIVFNVSEADEIVQDTLFAVYRNIDRIDGTRQFSSYVFTIAKNTAISMLRKHKKTFSLRETDAVTEDTFLYEQLVSDETSRRVKSVLDSIEKTYRRVIELYYFEDKTYEEIHTILHMPLNTVRTNLRRAKALIKKLYEKS